MTNLIRTSPKEGLDMKTEDRPATFVEATEAELKKAEGGCGGCHSRSYSPPRRVNHCRGC